MLGNRKYCYPLTITDYSSRYLLACEGLESTQSTFAFTVFEHVFKEYGLPSAIRTDNGLPFASPNALFGLSKLAVWWLRLGIHIERIKPRHPQQNGRLERMHLTLKKEAALRLIDCGRRSTPIRAWPAAGSAISAARVLLQAGHATAPHDRQWYSSRRH